MRIKYRYLIYHILMESPQEISQGDISFVVREKAQLLFGDVGAGSFGHASWVRFFDSKTKVFVVRVPREFEMEARMSMCTITEIRKCPAVVRLASVAGCKHSALAKTQGILFSQLRDDVSGGMSDLRASCADLIKKAAL